MKTIIVMVPANDAVEQSLYFNQYKHMGGYYFAWTVHVLSVASIVFEHDWQWMQIAHYFDLI